jgi:phosphate transport system protein
MSQIDHSVQQLKVELDNMFELVSRQLHKAKEALQKFDKDLAHEVTQAEKRVNSLELQIDRSCENFIALFNPVAIDLRFVLAVLKINSNLERIGDIAEGISKYVIESKHALDPELMAEVNLLPMYDAALLMLTDVKTAFEQEDTIKARKVFRSDDYLDHINLAAIQTLTEGIRNDAAKIEDALYIISIIRKLERIGDQSKNIAEEIIFYIEAKVLKHSGSKK